MRLLATIGWLGLTTLTAVSFSCGSSKSGSGGGSGGGGASSGGGSAVGGGSGGGSGAGGGSGVGGGSSFCTAPATAVDTSHPTTVVGNGSAASCTEAAFRAAVATGGIVTFDCGAAPATITVTSEVPVDKDTTIDGANNITLDGGGTTRILHLTSAWNVATPLLTVRFAGGAT